VEVEPEQEDSHRVANGSIQFPLSFFLFI